MLSSPERRPLSSLIINDLKNNSFFNKKKQKSLCRIKLDWYLCRPKKTEDSLAQLVEHVPFKDGVLGSNPRRVTITKPRNAWLCRFCPKKSALKSAPLLLPTSKKIQMDRKRKKCKNLAAYKNH